ncbi:MAG: histidine kinase dimerization/phospho-acceptor domain-containing protein [Chloroflexota bacterium]
MNIFAGDPIMEMARWAVIGQLTAGILHEINNPMQAVRGAASLGLEELDDPEALSMYLDLTLRETERVVTIIERTRRVYRTETQLPTAVNIHYLLNEILHLTQKGMVRKNVNVEVASAENVPLFTAVFGEIALALLCPLLQMSNAIAEAGGGALQISATDDGQQIVIDLKTSSVPMPDSGFFLILCPKIVAAYGGEVQQKQVGAEAIIHITLPVQTNRD